MPPTPTNFSQLAGTFTNLIHAALPVIFGLAVLVFVWGLVKFIFRIGGDEKAVAEGKKLMIWGLIALFVLMSYMAIIAFVHSDIGLGPFGFPRLPEG